METQLLRKPEIFPSRDVLKNALGEVHGVLEELEKRLAQSDFGLTFEWHYYKDSKAWLCKVVHRKKTIFWLSVWDGFFKVSFYFLQRHLEGIAALGIDEGSFSLKDEWGKMIPLIFNINDKKQFPDLLKVAAFKKSSK